MSEEQNADKMVGVRPAGPPSLGRIWSDLRREGPDIEDAVERDSVHDKLAFEGGCCCEPDCWEPVYCGSVCSYHSRPEGDDDDETFSD